MGWTIIHQKLDKLEYYMQNYPSNNQQVGKLHELDNYSSKTRQVRKLHELDNYSSNNRQVGILHPQLFIKQLTSLKIT